MLVGRFRDGHPRVELSVQGEQLEFVVDTGLEGDIALPRAFTERLGPATGVRLRRLADGSPRNIPVHEVEVNWAGSVTVAEVLVIGEQPLLGTSILYGHHLHVEMSGGGEV